MGRYSAVKRSSNTHSPQPAIMKYPWPYYRRGCEDITKTAVKVIEAQKAEPLTVTSFTAGAT